MTDLHGQMSMFGPLFLAHLSTWCSEWAIVITDRLWASVVHPSDVCSHFFIYTLASTSINQLVPNLVKMYMTIRSWMSLIMGLIGPEHLELFALELKNCCISLCLHPSIYKYQPITPNLVKIYMTIRSQMSSIMCLIGPERQELFALALKKLLYLTLCTL